MVGIPLHRQKYRNICLVDWCPNPMPGPPQEGCTRHVSRKWSRGPGPNTRRGSEPMVPDTGTYQARIQDFGQGVQTQTLEELSTPTAADVESVLSQARIQTLDKGCRPNTRRGGTPRVPDIGSGTHSGADPELGSRGPGPDATIDGPSADPGFSSVGPVCWRGSRTWSGGPRPENQNLGPSAV